MGHSHNHHAPDTFNQAFVWAIGLNLLFTGIEAFYAIMADSMSLLADAGHNLGDVLGLALAWIASLLLKKTGDPVYSYGYKKATVFASLLNALILYMTCGILAYESINKLIYPQPVQAVDVMIIALIGVGINGLTALMFIKGAHKDLNIKGAYLHLLYDALVSIGVVFVGLILYLGMKVGPEYKPYWLRLDPLAGLMITWVIAAGTWSLLKDSFKLALDGVPSGIDFQSVKAYLKSIDYVVDVHDLHIWGLSTKENALTCHLVVENNSMDNEKQKFITRKLSEAFHIDHVTIQMETEHHSCCSC